MERGRNQKDARKRNQREEENGKDKSNRENAKQSWCYLVVQYVVGKNLTPSDQGVEKEDDDDDNIDDHSKSAVVWVVVMNIDDVPECYIRTIIHQ